MNNANDWPSLLENTGCIEIRLYKSLFNDCREWVARPVQAVKKTAK
jgi:hypothetical protein